MRSAVVVDSGPLIALFDRDDAYHKRVVAFIASHPRLRLITTWAVLNETSALLGSRVGKAAELDFLIWVERGGATLVPQDLAALAQIRALVEKYRDLPFDFADASVAVLAAQTGVSQILTLDRDFEIYKDARGKRLKNVLPLVAARTR
jgi:predicted nucleic acid-binding protein